MAAMPAVVLLAVLAIPAAPQSFRVAGDGVSAGSSALTDPAARDFLENHEEKTDPGLSRPRRPSKGQGGAAAPVAEFAPPAAARAGARATDEPGAHLHVILNLKAKRRRFKDALAGLPPWFRPDARIPGALASEKDPRAALSGWIRPQDLKQAVQSPEFSRVSIVPEPAPSLGREEVVLGVRLKDGPFVAEETAREIARLQSEAGFEWHRSLGRRLALGGTTHIFLIEGSLPEGGRRLLPPGAAIVAEADATAARRPGESGPWSASGGARSPTAASPGSRGGMIGLLGFVEELSRNAPWILGLMAGFIGAGIWRVSSFLA